MKLSDFPLHLLQEMFSFLQPSVYKLYAERHAKLWRQFITAINPKYRQESIFLSLNAIHTLLFLTNESFREKVYQRIQNKELQLGLALHSLPLHLEFQEDGDDTDSSSSSYTTLSLLLNHIYYLKLRNLPITNLKKISKVTVLEIIDCPYITDVRHFGTVTKLLLFNCPGVTDVTGLGTVKELSLYQCPNIRQGFTTLTKVHRLCIEDDYLRSTVGFQGVQELFLTCRQLQTISPLENLMKISLHFCQSITDISPLSKVPDVSITYCDNITNIESLTGTKRLSITNCMKIIHINLLPLSCLHYLHIGFCSIQVLHIPKTSMRLESLSITGCSNLQKVEIYPMMKTVSIYGCQILQDIVIHNCLQSININYNSQFGPRVNIKGTVNSIAFNPITF